MNSAQPVDVKLTLSPGHTRSFPHSRPLRLPTHANASSPKQRSGLHGALRRTRMHLFTHAHPLAGHFGTPAATHDIPVIARTETNYLTFTLPFPYNLIPHRLRHSSMPSSDAPSTPTSPSSPLLPPPTTMTPRHTTLLQQLMHRDKDVSYMLYRTYTSSHPRFPLLLLEHSAHGVPWVIIPLLILFLHPFLTPLSSSIFLNFLTLSVLDLLIIAILKPLFRRSRPSYNDAIASFTLHSIDQYSFPSGHATRVGFLSSFVLYIRVAYGAQLHPFYTSAPFILITFIWAFVVCWSRVALGRHHVSDVCVGYVLGISYTLIWHFFWLSPHQAHMLRHSIQLFFLHLRYHPQLITSV